jgi:tRNA(Ile)-lysidine synthase
MASSRKRPRARPRIAVGLSGGVDSVVLLHTLAGKGIAVEAVHVHHGLSPNADAWAAFCRRLCRRLGVRLTVKKVKVVKRGEGLEAAARRARYEVFRKIPAPVVALAHHLDDQAETVLMNLLRGAGLRGASGMPPRSRLGAKTLWRPFLNTFRKDILAYARAHKLEWIDDEANADEALTRNFIRRRLAPLLDERFPAWKTSLARAARHFARRQAGAEELLRRFLASKGLRAPSEAKLAEMLKQLAAKGSRTLIEHDGARLRVYRGRVTLDASRAASEAFSPVKWNGESRLPLPALGGELRFKPGPGIGAQWLRPGSLEVRLRAGGERLQLHPKRPRRTLKNLFQEAGVPPQVRERTPLLFRGAELVWVPGLGVDVRYRGFGLAPQWRSDPEGERRSPAEIYDEVTGARPPASDSRPLSHDHSRFIKARLRARRRAR